MGLLDRTINQTKTPQIAEFDFSIKEFYIFNKDSILISSVKFKNEDAKTNLVKINKLVNRLFGEDSDNLQNSIDNNNLNLKESLSPSGNNNTENNNNNINKWYSFRKIFIANKKIYFLHFKNKLNFTFVTVFGENTKGYLIKLYMFHLFISFVNFNLDSIESLNTKSKDLERSYNYITNDNFQIKLFELYFVTPLTYHFEKVFKILLKKEEMYLSYIKFKNFYLVDLSNNEILFDMMNVTVS